MRDAKEEAERHRKVNAKLAIAAAMRHQTQGTVRTKNPVADPDGAFDVESADSQTVAHRSFDTDVEGGLSTQPQIFEDGK